MTANVRAVPSPSHGLPAITFPRMCVLLASDARVDGAIIATAKGTAGQHLDYNHESSVSQCD